MITRLPHLAFILALASSLPLLAAEEVKPVRTGSGVMTFETVPGWGLLPDGKSALGATHGAVVIDKEGNIYTSAQKGVVVFSPDGKVIRSFEGKDYSKAFEDFQQVLARYPNTRRFNEIVGERSEANGFRVAAVIADGELGEGVGGGTCQVAGTLHAAAYFAGLPIVERGPHSRPSFYIKMGMDAMVSYPNMNLKFTNDLPFPIALGMTVQNGLVRAQIRGRERSRMVTFVRRIDRVVRFVERDVPDPALPSGVRVLKQRGIPGFRVSRWRVVRNVAINQAVRQRSEDEYPPTDQIWRVGAGGAAPAGFVPPPGDDHPEYTADEYLAATQGPGIDGTQEAKRAGRTGAYGWTVREGFARAIE